MASLKERSEARKRATQRSKSNVMTRKITMAGEKRDEDREFLHTSVYPVTKLDSSIPRERKVPERPDISQCNVLFINPSINPHTQTKLISSIIRTTFPMSLAYVAAYLLEKKICECYVIDEEVDGLDDEKLKQLIEAMPKPRIVAFSILTATCGPAYATARKIKEIDPDVTIVMGGVHVTCAPEETLREGCSDVSVIGEGEETFAEIVQAIFDGKDYRDVYGICYLDDDDKFQKTTDRPLPRDLDLLPPLPYHLFAHNADAYGIGFYSIQTSRGCPYKCTFCSTRSMTALTYRYYSTDRAIQDIITLIEDYGADVIHLNDDNIAVNKKRIMRLLDGIIALGLHKKVRFEGSMRADNMDDEIYEKLKEANFSCLYYGMETGVERLMQQMQKGETVQNVVDAINETHRRGFKVGTTLIFGWPGETFKDRWDTIRLVYSLPLDSVRFNILTPYPGTPVFHEIMDSDEPLVIRKNWLNFSVQYMWEGSDLPYVPSGTNRYALMFITMFANLWYYLRPKGLWKLVTTPVAGGNVVTLPSKWFLSTYLFRMMGVGFYLIRRFLVITFMLILTSPLDWARKAFNAIKKLGPRSDQPAAVQLGDD